MLRFYEKNHPFAIPAESYDTKIEMADNDTFTEAAKHPGACCLNFASHKRPGGGYKAVQHIPMPIKTQEEDLFRRSDLPEIMDTEENRKRYPLKDTQGLYCLTKVTKDAKLTKCDAFETAIVTVPALVNPKLTDLWLVELKMDRILEIAAVNGHKTLILGAWGCGVFHNDPRHISKTFRKLLDGKFKGVFERVIFAIPGKNSRNYQVFEEALA